jgi:hypothetical protein
MRQATPEEMARRALLMRARNEGNVVRAYFLNEVLPQIEKEFDRRLASGENLSLEMPPADAFARAYVKQLFKANKQLS